jgi:hypothetical protein
MGIWNLIRGSGGCSYCILVVFSTLRNFLNKIFVILYISDVKKIPKVPKFPKPKFPQPKFPQPKFLKPYQWAQEGPP